MTTYPPTATMLGSVGDLVEDVHVQLAGPINIASDTSAVVSRSRGGSAANVAVAAAAVAGHARFIGQVGDDSTGAALVHDLVAKGVEPVVRRRGRTGTVVVLVHDGGERTMLSDRGASRELTDPDPTWLDGLHTLHVPFYSLTADPLAATTRRLVSWARSRAIVVSIDASSTAEIRTYGLHRFSELLRAIEPDVLFCNEDEATLLAHLMDPVAIGARATVTHGPAEALVRQEQSVTSVPAHIIEVVHDTTGAGDAFAAGFLVAWAEGAGAGDAAQAGHDAARHHVESQG